MQERIKQKEEVAKLQDMLQGRLKEMPNVFNMYNSAVSMCSVVCIVSQVPKTHICVWFLF